MQFVCLLMTPVLLKSFNKHSDGLYPVMNLSINPVVLKKEKNISAVAELFPV